MVKVRGNASFRNVTNRQILHQDLETELDNLLTFHDAEAGTLIKECEALIDRYTRRVERFSDPSNDPKMHKLRVCTQTLFHSSIDVPELTVDE